MIQAVYWVYTAAWQLGKRSSLVALELSADDTLSRARSLSASPRGVQDLALRRRRSVSSQDRPSPPVRAEEAPVPVVKPMPLQIDAPLAQTRKRRISGIDTPRVASPFPEVELAVQPTPARPDPARQIASTSRATTVVAQRERILSGETEPTDVTPSVPTVQESADQGARVRKRTSIATIVTSVPIREELRTKMTSPPNPIGDEIADDFEGKYLSYACLASINTNALQQLRHSRNGSRRNTKAH